MSQSEYFDWLLRVGTGWLGWTYDQTLDTPMVAIVEARDGRLDMLGTIFGRTESPKNVKPVSIVRQLAAIKARVDQKR